MNTIEARDMVRLYLGRILSSVLSKKNVGLYLCDKDLQDIALYNLMQAGEVISQCEGVVDLLALTVEDAEWIRSFYRMTAVERSLVDHAKLWARMSALIPLVA